MARTLLAEIVTPERIVYTNEVQMVVATTIDGEIGILPLHAPVVTALGAGEIRLKFGEAAADWEYFSIAGGYLQVHEDKVIVLADQAIPVAEIDRGRLGESKKLIEERLAGLPEEAGAERSQCELDLAWCEAQMRAAEKYGSERSSH